MPRFVDTHTHVNFQPFLDDYRAVIQRATDQGILVTNVGTQWESSQRSVQIADELQGLVYATVGLHPLHLFKDITEEQTFGGITQTIKARAETFDPKRYQQLAQSSPRVVAIGECGLDYYHTDGLASEQQRVLRQHIELGIQLDLPLIIHCRDAGIHTDDTVQAFDDLAALLSDYKGKVRGTIHCYTGTPKYIERFLKLGFYIGFTGIVTFTSAKAVRASVQAVPLERLLLETDAPYLAPVPHRGQRNEPAYVQYVAQEVAQLKQIPLEQVAKQTTANAVELFRYR
ncbi:MAG: TatD family hydrolase [Candidatus Kerfeldbacteria bacterium]|nr:TatD family hydrolase [Candidatus Kerfeldbacteria bacterium]